MNIIKIKDIYANNNKFSISVGKLKQSWTVVSVDGCGNSKHIFYLRTFSNLLEIVHVF